jgi:hypothetical protein
MLTPEQAQDLVDWAGTNVAAARIAGVGESTIRYWRDPEQKRANSLKHSLTDYRRYPERRKKRVQERRARRKANGLCVECGEPGLTEIYCWTCASKKLDRSALSRL